LRPIDPRGFSPVTPGDLRATHAFEKACLRAFVTRATIYDTASMVNLVAEG